MRAVRPASTIVLMCLAWVLSSLLAHAQLFDTRAKQAFMMDEETGTVLFSKNADELIQPASLAKLMTLELVFNSLKAGRLHLDDEFVVSENAWRKGGAVSGGSTMFAKVHSSVPLEALIQGIAVQSANDGCITVAEGMSGSEDNFAREMTARARQLGLEKSVFTNSTGLPDPNQHVTIRELVLLARHIHQTYPEYFKYFSEESFTWNKILQRNRNPLLKMDIGVDGMKTGHTDEAGYAIVATAGRDGRRLLLGMSGLSSDRERMEESRKMLDWGFRAFEKMPLFALGDVVGEASVYGGDRSTVDLKARKPIDIFVPLTNRDKLKARIVYTGPILAPVREGQEIGVLKVWIGDTLSQETPVYAAEDIGKGTLRQQAMDALAELATGWIRKYR